MPVATDIRLKIAVFIDFDNIEIGVKTTLSNQFDVGAVLEAIKERGDIISKIAYGDWKRSGDHSRALGQHAVRLVQRNLTPGGDKNGADINLALDALEMALTHTHINAYVIVGGDSDFITLVEKLKQYDKQVFIVGGRQFTSVILQKNCHEFIAYENLVAPQRRGREARERAPQAAAVAPAAALLDQVFPLVERALGILSEREVSPQLGLLKSTLLQLDSTFSERDYGASTFRDFVDKLAQAGLVTLNQSGRSVFVELRGRASDEAVAVQDAVVDAPDVVQADEAPAAVPAPGPAAAEPVEPAGDADAAVRIVRAAFDKAPAPRWPMYIRNVKQVVKAYDPAFDERRYGLGGLIDLLRACQRDGLLRLERDRKGVLRVFQGQAFARPDDGTGLPSEGGSAVEAADALVGLPVVDDEPVVDEAPSAEELAARASAIDTEPVADADGPPAGDVESESGEPEAGGEPGAEAEAAAGTAPGERPSRRRRAATTKRVTKAPKSRRAAARAPAGRGRAKKPGGQQE